MGFQLATLAGLALLVGLFLFPAAIRAFGDSIRTPHLPFLIKQSMRRCRTLLHVVGLLLASAGVSAIICSTRLGFFWLYVLIVVLHVPIGIQTGVDYLPHPVFDHPLFLPLSLFFPVLIILITVYGMTWVTRVRWRLRKLMVALAVVGLFLGGGVSLWREFTSRWRMASIHWQKAMEMHQQPRPQSDGSDLLSQGEEYHTAMALKWRNAALRPWGSVPADPLEP